MALVGKFNENLAFEFTVRKDKAKFENLNQKKRNGGPEWTRTIDHYHVKVVLYQLSYGTEKWKFTQNNIEISLNFAIFSKKRNLSAIGFR